MKFKGSFISEKHSVINKYFRDNGPREREGERRNYVVNFGCQK